MWELDNILSFLFALEQAVKTKPINKITNT